MRVIVTGSRVYRDGDLIAEELRERYKHAAFNSQLPLIVVQGGAAGADYFARTWAEKMEAEGFWVRSETYKADWDHDGKAAGPIRNMIMVNAGADEVLGFFQVGAANRGTTHCTDYAELRKIKVTKYI